MENCVFPKLRSLYLRESIDKDSFCGLFTFLCSNTLEVLDLSSNHMGDILDGYIEYMGDYIVKNKVEQPKVKKLYFSNNNLKNSSVEYISQFINPDYLEVLDLSCIIYHIYS